MINLSIPDTTAQLHPRITVVGVGGAGGNAVNNMIRSNLEGVEFLVANTDAQALAGSQADRKLQLGTGITQGLGAGSRPDVGRAAAEEAIEQIVSHLEGSHMVFITAGMGGGTGTGAAPVIARAAREQGMLTVGVVTKPFHFEGALRMRTCEAGLQELQQYVDTLIIIPNQNLFRIANEKTTFADAFKMADDVLYSGVRGVTDLMVMPGLINLDFADIRSVMSEMGKAMMGTGEGEGERRSIAAAEAAISNPLLDDVSMKGARGVLINITGGLDMTLYEVDEAANRIRDEVDPEANIIFGSTFDESMEGRIRVSVVSTGIDLDSAQQPRPQATPTLSVVGDRPRPPGIPVRTVGGGAGAVAVAAAQMPDTDPAFASMTDLDPPPPPAAEAVETVPEPPVVRPAQPSVAPVQPPAAPPPRAERREGAFVSPPPVQPAVRPQAAISRPAVPEQPREADMADGRPAEDGPRRSNNLFKRMTGIFAGEEGQREPRPPSAPVQPSQPVAEPTQPRLSGVDVTSRPPLPRHDDEALDIPAFLRRQAN